MLCRAHTRSCIAPVILSALVLVPVASTAFPRLTVNFGYADYMPRGCAAIGLPVRLHVVIETFWDGMSGAEFRLVGIDSTWQAVVTPAPTVTFWAGDPLGDGLQVAVWPPCQAPNQEQAVPLFTIDLIVPERFGERTIGFAAHTNSSLPSFGCPFVTLCDEQFTKLCVVQLPATLRDCAVGTHEVTWSRIKRLYEGGSTSIRTPQRIEAAAAFDRHTGLPAQR
jgi:hypothetical protein